MKIFALLPLLLLMSCQDTVRSRSLIDDTAVSDPGANVENPASPKSPGIPAPAKLHSRCQSLSRCFYARFPIYQQSYSGLENYIGNKIGQTNYSDPGLCAPTSAAMVLRAALDERDSRTRLNSIFLTNVSTQSWYETLYQIGVDSGTDFINGGTLSWDIHESFLKYFRNTIAYKSLYLTMETTWASKLSNIDIINLIKGKKPAIYFSVDALERKVVNNRVWYEDNGTGGHALAIKGFDGDRLHIQDPWGMDFFVRIKQESVVYSSDGTARMHSVFTDLPYSSGNFMGYYRNQKIVLDELMSLSID